MDMSKKITLITAKSLNETGFTLVELMIALFISGLVMASVVTIYIAQTKSYTIQDDISGIQQNLRGALAILPMEIRLAGCDPTESKIPKILVATKNQFQFTRDIRGNATNPNSADGDICDTDENITYGFTADTNNDGIADNGGANWSGTGSLGRQTTTCAGAVSGFQPLADNIEALEFSYIVDGSTTPTLTPPLLNIIRAMQVSILARATTPDSNYVHTSTNTYLTASGVVWSPTPGATKDNYRRRLVTTTIQLRNMR